jgi:hypothetical protein
MSSTADEMLYNSLGILTRVHEVATKRDFLLRANNMTIKKMNEQSEEAG